LPTISGWLLVVYSIRCRDIASGLAPQSCGCLEAFWCLTVTGSRFGQYL